MLINLSSHGSPPGSTAQLRLDTHTVRLPDDPLGANLGIIYYAIRAMLHEVFQFNTFGGISRQ